MKKISLVLIFLVALISILTITVVAVNTVILFEGANVVEVGSTNELIIKIQSSNKIGALSGKIIADSGISNITLEEKNGWTLTYDPEAGGEFNLFKASGAKQEEIMRIQYTVSNREETAQIRLTDLVSVDVDYQDEELEDVIETITISEAEKDENNTTNDTTDDNTSNDTSGENTSNDTSGDNSTNNNDTKKSDKITPKSENSTTEKKVLPHAGLMSVVMPIIIAVLGISAVMGFYGYKKYKEI